jgi:hypothetical protein
MMPNPQNLEPDYELMFDEQEGFVADFSDAFDMEEFETLGINPGHPTDAKPGSEDKVMMLAARYAAGMPLWHNEDCYDHAPVLDPELSEELSTDDDLSEEEVV